MSRILAINPGSTSTKIALYEDETERFAGNLHHSAQDLGVYSHIIEQYPFRLQAIQNLLEERQVSLEQIDAFVGRGGLLEPICSGTYLVDEEMLADLRAAVHGEHASNLGALLAYEMAQSVQKSAFIVDPVVVDERQDLARFSGHPDLPRRSIFHALNHKAVGRKAALQLGKAYQDVNLIIAHLGGGISIAAHQRGRVVDVNNALDGDGPFSPERSGSLPVADLVRLCFSGKKDRETILRMITGRGGVVAYTGTNNLQELRERIAKGDQFCKTVYEAMIYQVAKEIGAQSVVLQGDIDAIVITGGIANDSVFVNRLAEYCRQLAPILLFPGEEEMQALVFGVLRVLRGLEEARRYQPKRTACAC